MVVGEEVAGLSPPFRGCSGLGGGRRGKGGETGSACEAGSGWPSRVRHTSGRPGSGWANRPSWGTVLSNVFWRAAGVWDPKAAG